MTTEIANKLTFGQICCLRINTFDFWWIHIWRSHKWTPLSDSTNYPCYISQRSM